MKFEHCNHLGDLELEKKETNGMRLYNLPDGQWVPSITSVTSFYNRQIFIDWRKRVGVEEANKITKKATARGTDFHELDSIITRVGENTKIMFCGDATQTDLIKQNERNGIHDFMRILRVMPSLNIIEFGVEDIVRSGLCKEYLLAKLELGL